MKTLEFGRREAVSVVPEDPPGKSVLKAAAEGRSDATVSSDQHLPEFGARGEIVIHSSSAFLAHFGDEDGQRARLIPGGQRYPGVRTPLLITPIPRRPGLSHR